MSNFMESQIAELAQSSKEIANNTKHIVDALRFANQKMVGTSTHNHRIGALRRISKAIDYIKEIRPLILSASDDKKLDKIVKILLGNGGD